MTPEIVEGTRKTLQAHEFNINKNMRDFDALATRDGSRSTQTDSIKRQSLKNNTKNHNFFDMSLANNLETKAIGNRKIIIETRFDPIVSMLDKRGQIVDNVLSSGILSTPHWEVGPSEVTFRDCEERDDARNFVSVRFNRINIMSLQIDSVESYFDKFSKLYEKINCVIGTSVVRRIGCRVMGTYHTKSTSYELVLSNFLKLFPERLQLTKFPANDMLINLTYTGGMYNIGPLNIADSFYEREFNNSFCKKHVGVAIDTDNYITNEERPIDKISLIEDVYTLSLSVEKDLYSMLSEL